MKSPRVGIIILNWNGWSDTGECLRSLGNIDYPDYFTVLVDNGSVAPAPDMWRDQLTESQKLIEVRLSENLGFAGGCNAGIKRALANGAEYTLLLNNDTIVTKGFLSELVKGTRTEERYRVMGGAIYYHGTKDILWYAGGHINWLTGSGVHTKKRTWEKKIFPVTFITGCMLLIHRSVFQETGLLNTSYFLYCEDTDFCSRAVRQGIPMGVNLSADIYHKEKSTENGWQPDHIYYLVRNRILFMKSNSPSPIILPVFYISLLFFGTLPAVWWGVTGRWDLLAAVFKGVFDGIKNLTGPRKKAARKSIYKRDEL